ncbi:MAG: ABC transporter ATP-binding protein [Pedosphaera sp.]|nr:ABC transporter ATP-binding protein [Pedosphaera sp.]
MARVVIENLSKVFKTSTKGDIWAVKEVDLVVEDQEFLVLVGPSGCGKSTLLRMIAGLEDVSQGAISVDGVRMNEVPPGDRDVAMVFQNYALYPHMTTYENIAFGLKLRRFSKPEIDTRVRETAELLSLSSVLDRLPNTLSGGQRQRVAVGRAIVRKPKVFLFDEPLSNLDAPMRAQMRRELSKLHARLASTMILVTHDQVEAMTMGDRVAVMKEGVVQQVAAPITLYNKPVNRFVAEFIGSPPMNLFRGVLRSEGSTVYFHEQSEHDHLPPGRLSVRLDDRMSSSLTGYDGSLIVFGIRSEDILVNQPTASGAAIQRTAECVVESIEPMGSETYLSVTTGVHSFIVRVSANFRTALQQRISLTFDMTKAHFFDPATEGALNPS